jgi:methionyl-tRNA formyltransferase
MAEPLRIVYFGTPGYAAPTLRALAGDPSFDIVLVVTQPDRPAGRGRKLTATAVKIEAERLSLRVYQPESLRTAELRRPITDADADLFIVAAYGLIFGEKTLAIPKLGALNLHASLLPAYRGASPISAAILNGDVETGVTLMKMERGLDTGPMIGFSRATIGPGDTTESLTHRLSELGAELALSAIPRFVSGELTPVPQPSEGASLVRPLVKSDGRLDWRKSADELERQVRAMWPWPRAWFVLDDAAVQVHAAGVAKNVQGEAGVVASVDQGVVVACSNGGLRLDLVQSPGGNPMSGSQFASKGRVAKGFQLPLPEQFVDTAPLIQPVD